MTTNDNIPAAVPATQTVIKSQKPKREVLWGVISEDSFSLFSPRVVETEHKSLDEAFEAAAELIKNGTAQCSIVRCVYSKRHECFVEVADGRTIQIDARNLWDAISEMDDDEAEELFG